MIIKLQEQGKHPREFLTEFKGYMHTDGYAGYNDIPNVTIIGCWAHARRKFNEAITAIPDKTSISSSTASEGLKYCNKLFQIERLLAEVTSEYRYNMRLEKRNKISLRSIIKR